MQSQYSHTVVQTISNPDDTVSIIHVDPNNPVITLPDGTQAHVQGVTTVRTSREEGMMELVGCVMFVVIVFSDLSRY